MLGDYMDYNARPDESDALKNKPQIAIKRSEDSGHVAIVLDSDLDVEDEDGYDPYDHPIDRRFLE